ncbi:MAG: aromatic-ring-hydroxylating dioxygenase subunit beta [Chloroflexota bacterium]
MLKTPIAPHTDMHQTVSDLIYSTCLLLDQRDFKGWLDLCAPDFMYSITAYSPEIRKDMIWLEHDLSGMLNLVKTLPRHNSDQSLLTRHASVYRVDYDDDRREAEAVTSVAIYKTALDGGATEVFAVGRYQDSVSLGEDEGARFLRRRLALDTRGLGIGSHYPL